MVRATVAPAVELGIGEDKQSSCAYARILHLWTHILAKHHCLYIKLCRHFKGCIIFGQALHLSRV